MSVGTGVMTSPNGKERTSGAVVIGEEVAVTGDQALPSSGSVVETVRGLQ
jgi:hypothetical protein